MTNGMLGTRSDLDVIPAQYKESHTASLTRGGEERGQNIGMTDDDLDSVVEDRKRSQTLTVYGREDYGQVSTP